MEKKGNRSIQPSTKGLGTDSKKSQDVTKLWPRNGRRREPNGGTFAKTEGSRKPTQRNKTIDKRPRPRGYYYSGSVGGKEDAGLENQEPELGSVFVQGSRKQSLNHLLNFHFEPRESRWDVGASAHSKFGHHWASTFKHKYNKEQYLQANCQFIVQESGDYKQYVNNPDALVDWDLIEQVNIHVLQFPSCPICLYPPVAAKITRCGHIYCWSCLLHYLALSDRPYRKCPICYDAVHKKDLKSVIAIPHATFNINETITFKLMKRTKGSLIAYPVEHEPIEGSGLFKVSDKNAYETNSKLLLAGKSEVIAIVARERREVQLQYDEDKNTPEKCFIEEALLMLEEREKHLLEVASPKLSRTSSSERESTELDEFSVMHSYSRPRYESGQSDTLDSDDVDTAVDSIKIDASEVPSVNAERLSSKTFYFYQASDGQHIYLHGLNTHMLEHTYGCLKFCPKEITGRIIEKETKSMTEDIRKRVRYLQHLPVTCQYEVVEIQLKAPIVSKETLDYFRGQIEGRRQCRQRKARDEKRREKRIAEEENKKMGKFEEMNIRLESQFQFPEFQPEPSSHTSYIEEDNISSLGSTPPSRSINTPSGSLNNESEYVGMSFAKMVLSNKSSPPKKMMPSTVNLLVPKKVQKNGDSDEADIEGYVPVPAFNQSFEDAIAMALEKAANNDDSKVTGKKKKKNKSKKILFSTTMGYSAN